MRTIFTSEDVKNIVENIFNGNLKQSKFSNGKIEYKNPNSEQIILIDEDNGKQEKYDLAKYLNIDFYNWKNRLVRVSDNPNFDKQLSVVDDWVKSLNFSMNEAYALVEVIDEEDTASQDIDSASIMGRITFIIQTNKVYNLDYYTAKLKNAYLGVPQDIQNSYGEIIKAFIFVGALMYDEEPRMTQIGETMRVSCNFKISYLANALTYNDTKISISLDGDDLYDESGNIVNAQGEVTKTKFLEMPLTKVTWQDIFNTNPVSTAKRPDLTGYMATAISFVKTFSFFDFNKPLTMAFNDLFWNCTCYRKNGKLVDVRDVNIPVYIRVESNGNSYVYKDVIENMQKNLTNNDFNICSITLRGWGKLQ